jgi:hypothetical protein
LKNYYRNDSDNDVWFVDFVQWLRLALSKGPNRIAVSLPSPENGNRYSFRNVVFSESSPFS